MISFVKLSAKSARLDMYTSLRKSFESVATTPIVHVQGMRCVPHVQHAAVWVICGNATRSNAEYLSRTILY
jgi:hypothetical protein